MENKIYNDDVERVVNGSERKDFVVEFHTKRQKDRQRKMIADAAVYAVFSIAFGVLGLLGWMTLWISFPLFWLCGLFSAFRFGRWFENGKCWGWR